MDIDMDSELDSDQDYEMDDAEGLESMRTMATQVSHDDLEWLPLLKAKLQREKKGEYWSKLLCNNLN